MTSVSSVFVVNSVGFEAKDVKRSTIFSDVEEAKLRLLAMRRAAKRRLEESSNGVSEPSTGSFPVADSKAPNGFSTVFQSLLEAETSLREVRSLRAALESRKAEVEDLMKESKAELNQFEVQELVDPKPLPIDLPAPKKKQRYFESAPPSLDRVDRKSSDDRSSDSSKEDEDISSIVCPYESLGTCTDLEGCRYMHLNR